MGFRQPSAVKPAGHFPSQFLELVIFLGQGYVSAVPMNEARTIDFVLRGRVDGVEITPATIGLSRFNEFNRQVEEFVGGTERLSPDGVRVRVEPGSYKLKVLLPALAAVALEPDLRLLRRQDSLGEIDPKRAEVIVRWQAKARMNRDLAYEIAPEGDPLTAISLDATTDYRIGEIVPWVRVEKYLFGEVMDMGGAQRANVHIRLRDSGKLVRVGTDQDYLRDQEENRLYRKVLVRVEGEQHHRTGELRNLRLLSFEDYAPRYDEGALDRFAAAGSLAWADVSNPSRWVEELRGAS